MSCVRLALRDHVGEYRLADRTSLRRRRVRCPHCGQLIEEKYQAANGRRGAWRATKPEVKGHAGFRLNALVSPLANAAWAKLAAEFLAAKDHPDLLQPFINTVSRKAGPVPAVIFERTSCRRVPRRSISAIYRRRCCCLTVGADIQDDRIEASVLGWTKTGDCLILGHLIIWGAFTDGETWNEFDELLKSKWSHPSVGN